MKIRITSILILLITVIQCSEKKIDEEIEERWEPPFEGTIFIDPRIILAQDSSAFVSLEATGIAERVMYDRREDGWITNEPFLFLAKYSDSLKIEFQINSEFGDVSLAEEHALRFAYIIGQLPRSLRNNVETSWIHKGKELFGGGNKNLLIYIEQSEEYHHRGILEEVLVHEATHTSLDDYSAHPDWHDAQRNDPTFISTYARDNPDREDLAESFLPYLAIRYRSDRIPSELTDQIEFAMYNRIQFFDVLDLDLYPFN